MTSSPPPCPPATAEPRQGSQSTGLARPKLARAIEGKQNLRSLWTGPAARTHAGQLDISQLPEILRAQRRHLARLHHHQQHQVETAVSDATRAIHQALRAGTWIPGQRQRLHQLAPGTWNQALANALGASPGRPDDSPSRPVVEVAIYPDVVWLAARSLREHSTSHRQAS